MTLEDAQDRTMKEHSFGLDKDYEYPDISREEFQLLVKLQEIAKTKRRIHALEDIWLAKDPLAISQAYKLNSSVIRVILEEEIKKAGLVPILDKLDKISDYEGVRDFIIHDGGEIREGRAYKKDGDTVKPGWIRLYWK